MADDFPTEYDAIILGTGLPEAVIAAALARVGKSVLHLDRNEYYSSEWATFTFDGLLGWIEKNKLSENQSTTSVESEDTENPNVIPLPIRSDAVRNVVTASYFRTESKINEPENNEQNENTSSELPESNPEDSTKDSTEVPQHETSKVDEVEGIEASNSSIIDDILPLPTVKKQFKTKPAVNKDMTFEDFRQYFRQFNIDLAPKLLFSRGLLVEAIVSANISHYAEFKAVNRILTCLNGTIQDVPCSRSDVFTSKLISAIEKRTLMKFLTLCLDFETHADEYQEYIGKPFIEFLQSRRMTANLQHFVLHSISMLPPDADTISGLKKTHSFLYSLGRFSNTPFIWPLYGIGELPQAFCRMSAVFGGLYCLRRGGESISVDSSTNTCLGITSEGQFLKCKWIVMGNTYLPSKWRTDVVKYISRAVFITDKSFKESENGAVTLMSMPRDNDNGSPITVIELDNTSAACPRGLNVVHMVTDSSQTAEEDLKPMAEELLHFPKNDDDRESSKPVVLWSLYFNHAAAYDVTPLLPGNVHCPGFPGSSLGFDVAMDQAKKIFHSICGKEEEFLPAIPNPEDIIMDDVPPEGNGNHSNLGDGEAFVDQQAVNQDTVANENDKISPPVNQLVMDTTENTNNDSPANQETVAKENASNSPQSANTNKSTTNQETGDESVIDTSEVN